MPAVANDTARRQFTVTVPHGAWDPGIQTVRMAAGVGVWDTAAGSYLAPGRRPPQQRPAVPHRAGRP